MRNIDILIPFALPPATMAADLRPVLKTPSLAALISRARSSYQEIQDNTHALPHETWLSGQFGLAGDLARSGSPPLATLAMRSFGLTPSPGAWFILNPVHVLVARKHLELTDSRQIVLSEPESRALFDAAQPYFGEIGKALHYGDATTWFIHADDWADFQTTTPDATCGQSLDRAMPKGAKSIAWRKLQNEMQMLWFVHPVNQTREAQGMRTANSLWLWGGATEPGPTETGRAPYSACFGLNGWARGFRQRAGDSTPDCNIGTLLAKVPDQALLVLDSLTGPALANDWSEWLDRMHQIEAEWLTPTLAALKGGQFDQITLILSHSNGLSCLRSSRFSQRKFWIKPSLNRLLP